MTNVPAPKENKREITEQPLSFRKTGIVYEIASEICTVENCGMWVYNATYQGRDWEACYYCKVKRYVLGIEHGCRVWSGYSVMI